MQSNGGIGDAEEASRYPVRIVLSGPAAGVAGAKFSAERAGFPDLITLDMGGTSCDVSLVRDGHVAVTTTGRIAGYPLKVPMVDVHTIGAGGGSIAWLDRGGALRVGPQSAGANPGPVCYARGGSEPTVPDAQLVLGRIDPHAPLGGQAEPRRGGPGDPHGRGGEHGAGHPADLGRAGPGRSMGLLAADLVHDYVQTIVRPLGGSSRASWRWSGRGSERGRARLSSARGSPSHRSLISPRSSLVGPAVLEGQESTALLPPASRARVDPLGNLILAIGEA